MRLIIVSNRLPISIRSENGKLKFSKSAGGVISGLSAYLASLKKQGQFTDFLWVGWPGIAKEQATIGKINIGGGKFFPVELSQNDIDNFYHGFSNATLWPVFHSFPSFASFENDQWNAYKRVNELYAAKLAKTVRPGDAVWIQDYQLMLVPKMLKERLPFSVPIGFFLHIPFPHFEIFRLLPDQWGKALLLGMLGADLVGFHTYDYTHYFASCVQRMLGMERSMDKISSAGHETRIDTFPMGIDFQKFHQGINLPKAEKIKLKLKQEIGNLKAILSVDRLDYTKGIIKRLHAYEQLLEKYPEYKEKIMLVLIVVPSREFVGNYQEMKKQIDELVGNINGKFGTLNWLPITYQFKSFGFEELVAFYNLSSICLVTPLRDGMNLVAKEYLASRRDLTGVLILSEMAGAAQELGEAIIINPHHTEEITEALRKALMMPEVEQKQANRIMQERLKRYDVTRWANDFLKELVTFHQAVEREHKSKILNSLTTGQLLKDFNKSTKRIFLFDYDGTLMPFFKYPDQARPSKDVLASLSNLTRLAGTKVVIISGRDRRTLEKWFKGINLSLVAEFGIWMREGGKWSKTKTFRKDWKKIAMPLLRTYVDRVPGSFIEEKEYSIAWHYRLVNPLLAKLRVQELTSNLINLTSHLDIKISQGNKSLDIRSAGADKKTAANYFLGKKSYDFILAAGDDPADEDMFKDLPKNAYSIKVGSGASAATHRVTGSLEMLSLLDKFTS